MLGSPYDKSYSELTGEMDGCLGSSCSKSCCSEKKVFVWDKNAGSGGQVSFRTTLIDVTELEHQVDLEKKDPKLDELGVTIRIAETFDGIRYLVNGCLEEGVGCKLAKIGRKPTLCRTYPLEIGEKGFDPQCPAAQDIVTRGGEQLREQIISVDRLIGFSKARAQEKAKREYELMLLRRAGGGFSRS